MDRKTLKNIYIPILLVVLGLLYFFWPQYHSGPQNQSLGVELGIIEERVSSGVVQSVVVPIENKTDSVLSNIYFALYVYDEKRNIIANSFLDHGYVQGPWLGQLGNDGEITFTGVKANADGYRIHAYELKPGRVAHFKYDLKDGFEEKFGNPKYYRIEAGSFDQDIARIKRTSTWMDRIVAKVSRVMLSLISPMGTILFVCIIPLILVCLSLSPTIRKILNEPADAFNVNFKGFFQYVDKMIFVILVVVSLDIFFEHNNRITVGRDPDSFDYLSVAEVFGTDLGGCIGEWDKGYDRREFLHQTPDRSWGYPLFLSIVSRFADVEDVGCQRYMEKVGQLQVIFLIASCFVAAMLFKRFWPSSVIPYTRSGLVFLFLILDGYNFKAVNSILTEVPSRVTFIFFLASCLGCLYAATPLRRRLWILAGIFFTSIAVIIRPEHALVEPLVLTAFVFLSYRKPEFKKAFATFLIGSLISVASVMATSYTYFGTIKPSTSVGFHLLNVIHRMPPGSTIYLDSIPPGVVVNAEEKEFFEKVIIPAAKTPWGYANPWVAVPGFLPGMTPLEMSARMQEFSLGLLLKNSKQWIEGARVQFVHLSRLPNTVIPNTTEKLQEFFNYFGVSKSHAWQWPLFILIWAFGRTMLGYRIPSARAGSVALAVIVVICFYWHIWLLSMVETGTTRMRYFASGFVPLVGFLAVIDSMELFFRVVLNTGRRLMARNKRGRL